MTALTFDQKSLEALTDDELNLVEDVIKSIQFNRLIARAKAKKYPKRVVAEKKTKGRAPA